MLKFENNLTNVFLLQSIVYICTIKFTTMEKEKLEAFKSVVVYLPLEFDYKLNLYILENKRMGIRKTKAQLVAEFAQIGFLKEK